jgi:hypothetical protein
MLGYINGQSTIFSPEDVSILVAAFDEACKSVLVNLSDQQESDPEHAREILAKRIIQLAGRGERNQARLCREALNSLAITLMNEERPPPPAVAQS